MTRRRAILLAGIASIAMPAASPAQQGASSLSAEDRGDIARAESHLDTLRTLSARFLQVSDRGAVAEGKLHLHRPGRLRLDYAPPSPLLIIAAPIWAMSSCSSTRSRQGGAEATKMPA